MNTETPEYEAPPVWAPDDPPPSAPVETNAAPGATAPQQQTVVVQQPVTQIVYVDQFGNPIQSSPQQMVVVQQAVTPQQPVHPTQQGVELQIANSGPEGGYYVPSVAYNPNAPPPPYAPPENHEWVPADEVPPDYASTLESQNKVTGQDGHGCIAGLTTTHL